MADFDPSTAYANRWQYMRFVEPATWERKSEEPEPDAITGTKLRPLDLTNRRDQDIAAGLALTTEQTPWQWWSGDNPITDTPKIRDVIRQEKNKVGWVIQNVQTDPFGRVFLATTKEVLNVV